MVNFAQSLDDNSTLYLAVNNLRTRLTSGISESDTTIPVVTTSGYPVPGYISILTGSDITKTEAIRYENKTPTSFTEATRGAGGTVARTHNLYDNVDLNIVAEHHNVLKDAIIALEHFVGVSGSENFVGRDQDDNVSVSGILTISGVPIDGIATLQSAYDNDTGGLTTVSGKDLTVSGTSIFRPREAFSSASYGTPLFASQETQKSTNSTTFQDANCETAALLDGVDYLVIYTSNFGYTTATAGSGEARIIFGSTTLGEISSAKSPLGDVGNNHYNASALNGIVKITGNGSDTIKFQVRATNSIRVAYLGSMSILALPLDSFTENVDYFYEGTLDDTAELSGPPTWADTRSTSWSLNAEEYLFLFSTEGGFITSTVGRGAAVRYRVNNTTIGAEVDWFSRSVGSTDVGVASSHLLNIEEAGSIPVSVQGNSTGSGDSAEFRRSRMFAIRKSIFAQLLNSKDETGFSTSDSSFTTFSGLTTTVSPTAPNPSIPIVTLVTSNMYTKDANSAVVGAIRNETDEQNYRIDSGGRATQLGGTGSLRIYPFFTMHYETRTHETEYRFMVRSTGSGEVRAGRDASDAGGLLSEMVVWAFNPYVYFEETAIDGPFVQTSGIVSDVIDVRQSLTVSGVPVATGTGGGLAELPDNITVSGILTSSGTVTEELIVEDLSVPGSLESASGDFDRLFIDGTEIFPSTALGSTLKVWNPDAPPADPDSVDDEFDDATVGGQWTEWDPGSHVTVAEKKSGALHLLIDEAPGIGGVYRDWTGEDTTVYVKFSYPNNETIDYHEFGLLFADSDLPANPSTSNFVTVSILAHGTSPGNKLHYHMAMQKFNNYNSFNSNYFYESSQYAAGDPIYIRARVQNSARIITFDISKDGLLWYTMGSQDVSSDIGPIDVFGIWLHGNDSDGYGIQLLIDFVRVQRHLDASAPLLGNYVTISGIQGPSYELNEVVAASGVFSEVLTISGNPVSTGTGGGSPLTVRTTDSNPSVSNVDTIVVTAGTLTDDGGGQVTIQTGASGGGGSTTSSGTTVSGIIGKKLGTAHNPVGLWNFEQNLEDSSGNNFDLTVEAGSEAYSNINGLLGFKMGGGNDNLWYNATGSALQITGDITIEALVSFDDFSTTPIIVHYDGGSEAEVDNGIYSLRANTGGGLGYFAEKDAGTNIFYNVSDGVALATLVHVAMVRESNEITFYVNGLQVGDTSSGLSAPTGGTTSKLQIGFSQSSLVICSLKILDKALTSNEVYEEYRGTWGSAATYGELVAVSGTFTESLTISGVPVSTGTSGGSPLTVRTTDSNPLVSNVDTIVVTAGTLTDDGSGQVTILTGGEGVTTSSGTTLSGIIARKLDTTHSPVGLWNFDNNLQDSSGNGYTLTVETGAALYSNINGLAGVRLYGEDDSLWHNATGTSLQITGDLTVEALVSWDSFATGSNSLVLYLGPTEAEADNVLYQLYLNETEGGKLSYFAEYGSGANITCNVANSPALGTLVHVAMVRENDDVTFYLNGVQAGDTSSGLQGPTGGSNSKLYVGYSTFDGVICSLKILDKALTAQQIYAEYQRTWASASGYGELTAVSGTFSDSLTISGVPVSTGTGAGSSNIDSINGITSGDITITGTEAISVYTSGNIITIDQTPLTSGIAYATLSGVVGRKLGLTSDTVGLWLLNEGLEDSSSTGADVDQDGAFTGGPAGNGLRGGFVSDSLSYSASPTGTLQITGDVTIEAIFTVHLFPDTTHALTFLRCGASGDLEVDNILYTLGVMGDGKLVWFSEYGAGNDEVVYVGSANTIVGGTTHLVSMVRDSNEVTVYLDGSQIGSTTAVNQATGGTNAYIRLGDTSFGDSSTLGTIACAKVINRALTAEEVYEEYKSTWKQVPILSEEITAISGTFSESLTISGVPVSTGTGAGSSNIDDINGISSGSVVISGAGSVDVSTVGNTVTVSGQGIGGTGYGIVFRREVELSSPAAEMAISDIPGDAEYLVIQTKARSVAVGPNTNLHIQLNGDTGDNYACSAWFFASDGTSSSTGGDGTSVDHIVLGRCAGSANAADTYSTSYSTVYCYGETGFRRSLRGTGASLNASQAITNSTGLFAGDWTNTDNPISQVRVFEQNSNNLIAGSSLIVYGIGSIAATFEEVLVASGIFSESLTISGVPVSTGTGGGSSDITDVNGISSGSVTIAGAGLVSVDTVGSTITVSGESPIESYRVKFEEPAAFTEKTFVHNLNDLHPNVTIYDYDGNCLILGADSICSSGVNATTVTFDPAASGIVIFDIAAGAPGPQGPAGTADAIIGTDGITVISGSNNIEVQGFRSEFVNASGSLQTQIGSIESLTLQDVYDNGNGMIEVEAGKPLVISGTEYDINVDFKVVGSGVFTEALQVGSGTSFITSSSAHFAGNTTIKNDADSTLTVALDSGNSTTVNTELVFRDQGSDAWLVRKGTDNSFKIVDMLHLVNKVVIESGTHGNILFIDKEGDVSIANDLYVYGKKMQFDSDADEDFDFIIDSGGTSTYNSTFQMRDRGGTKWHIQKNTSNQLVVRDTVYDQDVLFLEPNSRDNAIYVKAGGAVGLGTPEPTSDLHVVGSGYVSSTMVVGSGIYAHGDQIVSSTYISVKEHGVAGDGITDDSGAIQAAVDEFAAISGSKLYIPAGNYRCLSTIIPKEGTTIIGAGRASTRLFNDANSNPVIAVGNASDDSTGPADMVTISDIHIEGNAATTEGIGVLGIVDDNSNWTHASRFVHLERVWITNVGNGPGLRVSAWTGTYDQVKIVFCKKGLELGHECNSNLFEGLEISACDDYAIIASGTGASTPIGCDFIRTTIQGHQHLTNPVMELNSVDSLRFDGLWLEGNSVSGTTTIVHTDENSRNVQFGNVTCDESTGHEDLTVFLVESDQFGLRGFRGSMVNAKYLVTFSGSSCYEADLGLIHNNSPWSEDRLNAYVHDATDYGQIKWFAGDTTNIIRNSSLLVQDDPGPWNNPANSSYVGELFKVNSADLNGLVVNVSINSSVVPNPRYPNSLEFDIVSEGTSTADRRWRIYYEVPNPEAYRGLTVTSTVMVKAAPDNDPNIVFGAASLQIGDEGGTTSHAMVEIDSTWATYQVTHVVDDAADSLSILFTLDAGSGDISDTGSIYMAGWTLSVGDSAPWCEIRPQEEEESLVRLSYQRYAPASGTVLALGYNWNTTIWHGAFYFPPMNSVPTFNSSDSNTFKLVNPDGDFWGEANMQAYSIANGYAALRLDSSGLTAKDPAELTTSSGSWIEFDAR